MILCSLVIRQHFEIKQQVRKCKCSFCCPAVNHSINEPIRRQETKSNIYDRIPPLISIASTVNNESIKNVNIPWSSRAELPKNSEPSKDDVMTAPMKEVESAHASSLNKPCGKQVTCSCSFCSKSFTSTRALELHVRRHSGLRPYPCKFCDKCFYQPSERAVHMRTHTGARPYRCPYCLKLFRYSGDLKQHINIHTGQRPYQCEICAKAFTNHSTLRQHKRIHTGERPYKCEECGKTYRYHSSLKQHLLAHAANKLKQKKRS
ncbi:zinc finger protein 525-like [Actinia tenebrosa]|uniref:Zinc finger protein 525-like n=1 Tax=Actinia tenebrosa TaxID=6105 RepID=A0A6P8H842_ACTTE|nr:zinc finger protein 525-like [Actinia tenebrosa]